MIVHIKCRIKPPRDRQMSYNDVKTGKLLFEVSVGDKVMLKVSPWKGVIRFGTRGKLNPRYIGPFKIIAKVGTVAYRIELPEKLSRVHSTFHVSNLLLYRWMKSKLTKKLYFIEEPIEIIDREVKRLKQSRIPIVKVRWNSRRGLEFTWDHEDQMQIKMGCFKSLAAENVVRVITPPTTQTDTTVIPTETPIIASTIPPSPDYTPASPNYSPAFDLESDPYEDPSSDHIPPLPAISLFLSSADDTTDNDTPDTPPSTNHGTPFTKITSSTQRSLVIPRRRVMILVPGQPIPHG
ncbi:hypothetical protein Tco_0396319 [Tanacetum coccineum]